MNRFGHANRRLQFYKRSQLFLRVHNETLSVAAMRVSNPDCSLARIHDCDAAPASSGLAEIVSDDFSRFHAGGFCRFCAPQNNDFFSLRVPEFPLKLNCHASITKRDSFRRLDQVPCDSDCLADHHLSGFDNRLRDVRLALGSVNRLAGRFAEICSAFKSDSRTISNSHSHN